MAAHPEHQTCSHGPTHLNSKSLKSELLDPKLYTAESETFTAHLLSPATLPKLANARGQSVNNLYQ